MTETNITDWRRKTVGDLTSAFRFHEPRRIGPDAAGHERAYNLAQFAASQFPLPTVPTTNQHFPKQEPGQRPSNG